MDGMFCTSGLDSDNGIASSSSLSRAEKGSRSRKHHLVASPLPRNAARFFLLGRWGGRHWFVDGKDSLVVVGIVSREMKPADMEGRWRRNTERGDFHFIQKKKAGHQNLETSNTYSAGSEKRRH